MGRWRNWFFRACFLRSDLRLRRAPDLTHKGASTSALQKAIGTGLGKAANVCKTTDLTFALEIQGDLGATGSPDANGQYAAITGNDPTQSVALSGAATGSSGGVGGQTTPSGGIDDHGTALFGYFSFNVIGLNHLNGADVAIYMTVTPGIGDPGSVFDRACV